MPPPALKALATKAGKSLKDAERYYEEAKKGRMKKTGKSEKELDDADYRAIMGVTKKRLGLKVKPVESYIDDLVAGKSLTEVVQEFIDNTYRE